MLAAHPWCADDGHIDLAERGTATVSYPRVTVYQKNSCTKSDNDASNIDSQCTHTGSDNW